MTNLVAPSNLQNRIVTAGRQVVNVVTNSPNAPTVPITISWITAQQRLHDYANGAKTLINYTATRLLTYLSDPQREHLMHFYSSQFIVRAATGDPKCDQLEALTAAGTTPHSCIPVPTPYKWAAIQYAIGAFVEAKHLPRIKETPVWARFNRSRDVLQFWRTVSNLSSHLARMLTLRLSLRPYYGPGPLPP